jgi:UDP-N-acetylmuramate dehydrogenase
MEILQNIPLAPLTTLRIGGAARFFVEARTEEQARDALVWAREYQQPLFILGGGSNLVVSDQGWPGLVVRIAIGGIEVRRSGDEALYEAGAGVDWDRFVARAVDEGCAGVECLSGIPGTVGGTPVQNVGAYGQEVAQTIHSVDVLDLDSLERLHLGSAECGFQYRGSRFNSADRGRYLILRVGFLLRPGGAVCLRYPELAAQFAGRNAPSLGELRHAVLETRRRKAMLVEDAEPDSRSVGSFFKNPLVSRVLYEQIAERWGQKGVRVPGFDQSAGRVKLPAAWLVEHSGICKGFQLGPVAISRKHALALVNRGGATAADLLRLKELVQAKVRETFAIQLQPEPVFVGFPESLQI